MVNTELDKIAAMKGVDYNILNIVVNTELRQDSSSVGINYNILNIVVNTERVVTP